MKASGFPYIVPMLVLSLVFFATPLAVLVGYSLSALTARACTITVVSSVTRSIFAS